MNADASAPPLVTSVCLWVVVNDAGHARHIPCRSSIAIL